MTKGMFVVAASLVIGGCAEATSVQMKSETVSQASIVDAGVAASANGSAHMMTGGNLRVVSFTAQKLADGTVTGTFTQNIIALGVHWRTDVECLTVVGNRAFIGGTTVFSSDARVRVGTKSYFWVEDRGEGADDPSDLVSLVGFNETQQGMDDFCGLVQNLLPQRNVIHGNVQVQG